MLETLQATRRIPALSDSLRGQSGDSPVIRPLPAAARFSLRLREADAAEIGEAAGFRFDQGLNSFVATGERTSLRLGPDEWLLIGSEADADTIAAEISAVFDGRFHALVDIGHRNVGIEIAGRHAAETLNAGCPLDLGDAAFPTGTATRTLLGKAEIILARIDDAPTYRVESWRSFATYVHGFLSEAARDFREI